MGRKTIKQKRNELIEKEANRVESTLLKRLSIEIAEQIKKERKEAGISQAELAERLKTGQSVISRLEDTDYGGHSIRTLSKIASALDLELTVVLERKPE